ncbi:MAG TPA: hypothetical protein DCS73_11495 [Roseburia sp.]|nr:hypothetical protein [Roseburia sp.]
MSTVRTFFKNADWKQIGVVAFYVYFAINILMKAFSYDHGDNIYKWFFYTALIFWGIKMITTTYTMREIFWIAVMFGIGVMLSVIAKQNMWLLTIMTVVAMKNCRFSVITQIAVWLRAAGVVILVGGSLLGIFNIGEQTKLDSGYVEQHVYGFAMGEPNTAFLTVFLALLLVLYYNYEKLNVMWCGVTALIALFFYKVTFCRTGVLVFFFCWALIFFEKLVKNKKIKAILVCSVPVGAVFSMVTTIFYNGNHALLYKINHLVSGRVYIMNTYFKDQGLSLLPRTQEIFYTSYHGLIDNSYMHVTFYAGILVAALFFWLIMKTMFKLYRMECYKELVMIGTLALYGVLEQFVLNGFMNIFILLCGILLYPDILEEKHEK